jgi:hypothetical protein
MVKSARRPAALHPTGLQRTAVACELTHPRKCEPVVLALQNGRSIMRASMNVDRNAPDQETKNRNRADSAVATIWLVFYMLALGVAFSSPFVYAALEIAAR